MEMKLGWTIDQASIGDVLWDSHDSQAFEATVEITTVEVTKRIAKLLLADAGVTEPVNKMVYKVDEEDYTAVGVCIYDDKARIYKLEY